MATLSFITPAEFAPLQQQVAELSAFMAAFIESIDDDVDTKTACQLTGISRETLRKVRAQQAAPGLIVYRAEGARRVYSRASCVAYKLRYTLPTSSASPLRLAS